MATASRFTSAFVLLIAMLCSCDADTVRTKARNTISTTGKTLGKGTTEFFKGVKEGVDKTLQCKVELSPRLSAKGLTAGKFYIGHSKGANDNILSVYTVFDKNFTGKINVKVYDKKEQEYGRTSAQVDGKAGEASYVDFIFSDRVEIESRSRFMLE